MERDFPDGKKVYFLDTSVIMHDPEAIEKLSADGNIVVILIQVLVELDKSKKFRDQAGMNSRTASRMLDSYREAGKLSAGVPTKSGGKVVVDCDGQEEYFAGKLGSLEKTVDHRIVATAMWWREHSGDKYEKVAVVTKDINLRVIADAFGVEAEDYETDKRIRKIDELYPGSVKIILPDEDAMILTDLPQKKSFSIDRLTPEGKDMFKRVLANECVYLDVAGRRLLAVYKKKRRELIWAGKPVKTEDGRVAPKNDEQVFEYALLMDKDIPLVMVTGGAGTGKTLISLLAGMDQMDYGKETYKAVRVYRPNVELGNPLGYLPGTMGQKFEPWMEPIFDNLSLIISDGSYEEICGKPKGEISESKAKGTSIEMLMDQKLLSIESINYARGRSLHKSFIIVDEAQNLTPHQVKTLVTRAGKGTKVVLTGDPTQIDNPYLDAVSNGLTNAVERLKGQDWAASITLRVGERSLLAERAAALL